MAHDPHRRDQEPAEERTYRFCDLKPCPELERIAVMETWQRAQQDTLTEMKGSGIRLESKVDSNATRHDGKLDKVITLIVTGFGALALALISMVVALLSHNASKAEFNAATPAPAPLQGQSVLHSGAPSGLSRHPVNPPGNGN
jgi:hypothetical protein